MSSFSELKELYQTEITTLERILELLEKEGFIDPSLNERLKTLQDNVTYWNDNDDTIYSLSQAYRALGFPVPQDTGLAMESYGK